MEKTQYHFEKKFSLNSSNLTLYNEVFIKRNSELIPITSINSKKRKKNIIKREFHNFDISKNAYRLLRKRMEWLHHLSKSRHIVTYSNKHIYSFKMAFITLTLSSKQRHSTSFLNSELLNQFLTEIRQRTKMQNYIWRLEFQENGNAHWHIATDTYIDYFLVKEVWNRIQAKLGYIKDYTKKHQKMNLTDYVNAYASEKTDFKTLAYRYAKGKKNDWKSPPSVDVRSVISGKSISYYLSKYFSKNNDAKTKKNDLDNEKNSKSLRLWFCSRSISKLNNINEYISEVDYSPVLLINHISSTKRIFLKYAEVFYFSLKELKGFSRTFLEKLLKNYANSKDYIPAI
jgi:hypothetical protein